MAEPPLNTLTEHQLLVAELRELRKSVALSNRQATLWYSFIRGAVTALGATVGVAIVLSLIFWVLQQLSFIPGTANLATELQHLLHR